EMAARSADLPKRVTICEEGPREGFQSEPPIATAEKLRLIEALAKTGLREINCVSFVDRERVPQMADAEDIAAMLNREPGVRYTGTWLNTKGFDRALASGIDVTASVFAITSDAFARKNNNRSADEIMDVQRAMIDRYRTAGLKVELAYVFTAFGCQFEGDVAAQKSVDTLQLLLDVCAEEGADPETLYFCDTVGAANPNSVRRLLGLARSRWPDKSFALHLHDTRGMGLANILAGLEMGVARFDTSIGGLGGCPFAGNRAAAGNVCTEDLVLMLEELGIETGLNLDALIACAHLARDIVGHPLVGKVMNAGKVRHHPTLQ
ncbi:MAG: hydroxymethylglutaryl-CoA lyase, partial [Rhodospirillales bacterium]|nr:hydroxymethylglutaryl-CoA lyase [Rhodospirillales bacterium]